MSEIVDEHGHKLGCPAYNQPTFTLCTCGATERAGLPAALVTESLSDIFDAIRGDIHLYEIGEVSFKSMLRGLRESMALLDAREVKR